MCLLKAIGPKTWFPKANGPKFPKENLFFKEIGLKTWFPNETQVHSILKNHFLGQIELVSP
jgi:hypothetical protein